MSPMMQKDIGMLISHWLPESHAWQRHNKICNEMSRKIVDTLALIWAHMNASELGGWVLFGFQIQGSIHAYRQWQQITTTHSQAQNDFAQSVLCSHDIKIITSVGEDPQPQHAYILKLGGTWILCSATSHVEKTQKPNTLLSSPGYISICTGMSANWQCLYRTNGKK